MFCRIQNLYSQSIRPCSVQDGQPLREADAKKMKQKAFDSGGNMLEVSALVLQMTELHYKCRMSSVAINVGVTVNSFSKTCVLTAWHHVLLRMDYCDSPIFHTHLVCMRESKETERSIQFQATRANKHWILSEIAKLFSQLRDQTVLSRLGITTAVPVTREEERVRGQDFVRLTVCTAAARSWHMLWYSESCPEQFAGILSNKNPESMAALGQVRDTALLVLGAERAARDEEHNDRVAPCFFQQDLSGLVYSATNRPQRLVN